MDKRTLHMMFIAVLVLCVMTTVCDATTQERVLLKDVKTLTLYAGEDTTYRRSSAVPQLSCRGKECADFVHPTTVQCYNKGTSYNGEVQWKCEAEMPNSVRFDRIQVSCEGYRNKNDPYVVR